MVANSALVTICQVLLMIYVENTVKMYVYLWFLFKKNKLFVFSKNLILSFIIKALLKTPKNNYLVNWKIFVKFCHSDPVDAMKKHKLRKMNLKTATLNKLKECFESHVLNYWIFSAFHEIIFGMSIYFKQKIRKLLFLSFSQSEKYHVL